MVRPEHAAAVRATWGGGIQYQLATVSCWKRAIGFRWSWSAEQLEHQCCAVECFKRSGTLQQIFQNYQNFKPYPQFGYINHYSNYGHSTYHGGTWRVEKDTLPAFR